MGTREEDQAIDNDPCIHAWFDEATTAVAIYTEAESAIASTIVYANRALCELSGYERDHFVGHSALLLAGARLSPALLATIIPGEGIHALELRVRKLRTDGSAYVVDVSVRPLRDRTGRVTHYLAMQSMVFEAHAGAEPAPPPMASGVFASVSAETDGAAEAR